MGSKRHLWLGSSILAGMVVLSAPAFAQSSAAPLPTSQEATEVSEIVVTGSRIRRDPSTAPTPLIQVTAEELLETGQSSVIEYLATIPALMNSQVPTDTTGSVLNAGGLSLPNLRSLGSGRTLSLVNGRRHVGSAAGSLAVDTDSIPRLLIQNVEIITGGASSVYGADAVSGVINYVMRDDFDGLEVDLRARELNSEGQMQYRASVLAGRNFMDDRLNVYGFGEYEKGDPVQAEDVAFLREGWVLVGNDADTTAVPADGILDNLLYRDVRSLNRMRWGQVTLAGNYQPSPRDNPNIAPTRSCGTGTVTETLCYGVAPGRTFVFDGLDPRLANFGDWVQKTGTNRTLNVGGDGLNPNTTANVTNTYPESERALFQTGFTFALTPSINIRGEAKYQDETSKPASGYAFNDVYISDSYPANDTGPILSDRTSGPQNMTTRLDNAFLPEELRAAILANRQPVYCLTAAGCEGGFAYGEQIGEQAMPFARYAAWTADRNQLNKRQLQRYVLSMDGEIGQLGFLKNVNWDIGYTYGRMDNKNTEYAMDGERFSYALDSVVDRLGVLGNPGQIVCRAQLLTANGGTVTNRNPFNPATGTGVGPAQIGANDPDIAACVPMNIFGEGNQSAEAMAYIGADITVEQKNEQHDVMGSISGQLGDYWGAGPIGVAFGGEWRKESTQGTGRDRDTAGRWLFLNAGPDFAPRSYESKEVFGEISIPLFRDSVLGDYAEVSASYRYFDFSTSGSNDVYGVNLVYRPIPDIAFKTSFNTSVRSPSLSEYYSPASQTFGSPTDVCDTRRIASLDDDQLRERRTVNCALLAQRLGFAPGTFNFADDQAENAYRPQYPSSVAGFNQGNPNLVPEESESFTFSVVLKPRFIPNLSVVLDYYEVAIDKVIATVSGSTNVALCVSGEVGTLVEQNCSRVTRSAVDDPNTPRDDRMVITSFVQDALNYARREVRGLDFSSSYHIDLDNVMGRNLGRLSHRIRGGWLIEQKNFNNIDNPSEYTASEGAIFYPRVRLTNSITWTPNDQWSATWSTDWMTSQDRSRTYSRLTNWDAAKLAYYRLGNFARNDLSVRYRATDRVRISAGVSNIFDKSPPKYSDGEVFSNYDPFGRRFNLGLNYSL